MTRNIKFFLIPLLVSLPIFWGINAFQGNLENFFLAQISLSLTEIKTKPSITIVAKAAFSIKTQRDGQETIILEKDSRQSLPIASLTKLMTSVIVAEDPSYDFEKTVAISEAAAMQGDVPHFGNLKAGDQYRLGDLFNLMINYSSNDSAFALAEVIGVDNFVAKMNSKAAEWKLENTHFENPTGLDVPILNFSTAEDLAEISKRILKEHPLIFETSLAPVKFPFDNGIKDLVLPENSFAWGGKTGETNAAGGCLVFIFQDQAENIYINILLGTDSAESRIEEMQKLINWIFPFDPGKLGWQEAISKAPWTERDSHDAVIFDNKIWLIGGLNGNGHVIGSEAVEYWLAPHFSDIWMSLDGLSWTMITDKAPWGKRRSIQLVNFNGKMWLMGGWGPDIGYRNDIWSSEDGINWVRETSSANWPAREGHSLVVFQDKLWLIGGVRYDARETFNDVWYSQDGINWLEATSSAERFSSRWDHAVIAFKNKLWLTAGMNLEGETFDDVWSSVNGRDWQMETDNPPWQARQGHVSVVYKNRLWLIGRFDDKINVGENDIWYTQDGLKWEKTEKDPLWTGREDHAVVVFKDKIWVLGGMDSDWTWKNDIWYSR
ncbi:MAG: serine hydrolase [bacterium]